MAKCEQFIQVGVVALRDPMTGGFGEAFPLYTKATPAMIEAREKLTEDIGKVFADKFRQYKAGCAEQGIVI